MPGLERINRCGRLIEGARRDFLKYYLKKCPTLFHICYDPIGSHRKARAFIGFLFGFVAAVVLYEFIIVGLQFDIYTSLSLGAILVVMLSIGCASSIQVRCICLLTIPTFLGRSGRNVLRALIMGYIIAGPIFNLTYNGKEMMRTFVCTTQLTYNLTKTHIDLMFKPFQQAVLAMKADSNELEDTLSSVGDLMSPIVEEIEGEEEMKRLKEENDYLDELQDDTRRNDEIEEKHEKEIASARSEADVYEAKYKKKIEARCQEQLSHGTERCRDMFSDSYDKCYDKVTLYMAWLLCWPMKLTFVCNLVQALGSTICNPEGKVDVGIGEGYVALKRAKDALSKGLKGAKLQYKVKKMPVILDLYDARDAAQAMMHEFNTRRKVFESVMIIIKRYVELQMLLWCALLEGERLVRTYKKYSALYFIQLSRCLSFVFLRIIVNAQTYHEKYLSEIEHDNMYITSYFRKIDARRKARGSLTLLPLKKIERLKFMDPYSLRPGKVEWVNLIGQMLKLILEIIAVSTLILIDRLFFEGLDLVRRHSYMEYTQTGHHDMILEIRGIGMIASLIRRVFHGFNVKRRVKTVVSNRACLPKAREVPNYMIFKIYSMYLAIWVLMLTTGYTQRLRRVICSFFYRKREKRRVLYLYNESLRRRLGHARFMRARVKTMVRTHRLEYDTDPWLALRLRWPVLCGWLVIFAWARHKCLICGEVEPRRGPQFRRCTTPGCPFVHCPECWDDVGRICYACTDIGETDDDTDEFDTLGIK